MNMRTKLIGTSTALVVGATLGLMPATAASAAPRAAAPRAAAIPAATTLPVTGTLANGTAFTGALSNLSTSVVNGVLQLSGTITGTGLPVGGTTFTTPLTNLVPNAACTILTLNLGRLNLNLLGLVVDLAPVNLVVSAVPGAGNLLGNLLCAVAGLLDRNGPLTGISALLNRLLTGLGL